MYALYMHIDVCLYEDMRIDVASVAQSAMHLAGMYVCLYEDMYIAVICTD